MPGRAGYSLQDGTVGREIHWHKSLAPFAFLPFTNLTLPVNATKIKPFVSSSSICNVQTENVLESTGTAAKDLRSHAEDGLA